MKRGLIIIILLLLVFVIGSAFYTGFSVLYAISDKGGRVNYNIQNAKNFIQCFDADPENLIDVKSVCHAQYYLGDKNNLRGMSAVDYCKSDGMVVDFYCGKNFGCKEIVSECERGSVCRDGACIKKENEFLKFFNFNELRDSFGRMFG